MQSCELDFTDCRNFFQDARSKFMPASIATLAAPRFDCPHDTLHGSNRLIES
jgi:hypothetical protein